MPFSIRNRRSCQVRSPRRGAAAVEFALMLPLLMLLFVIAVDFARVYRCSQIVTDGARTGAMFAANPDVSDRLPFESVEDAVASATKGLTPPPTVHVDYGVDDIGHPYVVVSVSYPFRLLTGLVRKQSLLDIRSSARWRLYPSALIEREPD